MAATYMTSPFVVPRPAAEGLYFLGTHFLRKRKSSLLVGVGEDAGIVARRIVATATAPNVRESGL